MDEKIEEIEETLKSLKANSDWEVLPKSYCENVEYLLSQIKEAKAEYEKLLNIKPQPVVPLKYCKEHKTICMPFQDKLACCLESRIKELEELTNNMGSDKMLSEVLYEYHNRADKAEAKVKELEEAIEKHKVTPYIMGCLVIATKVSQRDEELYKVLKER